MIRDGNTFKCSYLQGDKCNPMINGGKCLMVRNLKFDAVMDSAKFCLVF